MAKAIPQNFKNQAQAFDLGRSDKELGLEFGASYDPAWPSADKTAYFIAYERSREEARPRRHLNISLPPLRSLEGAL